MEQDLTQGTVSRALIRFVLPFLAASILQFLYSVVDMIIVGQFADPAAISAVNTSGQIMQMITGLVSGIATGGTVLIGQAIGRKRQEDVRHTIGRYACHFSDHCGTTHSRAAGRKSRSCNADAGAGSSSRLRPKLSLDLQLGQRVYCLLQRGVRDSSRLGRF